MADNAKVFWERLEIAQIEYERMTLQSLCRMCGIPYQTVINQKCQKRYPSVDTIMKFAKILNCSVDWLLFGSEQINEERVENLVNKVRGASSDQFTALETLLIK